MLTCSGSPKSTCRVIQQYYTPRTEICIEMPFFHVFCSETGHNELLLHASHASVLSDFMLAPANRYVHFISIAGSWITYLPNIIRKCRLINKKSVTYQNPFHSTRVQNADICVYGVPVSLCQKCNMYLERFRFISFFFFFSSFVVVVVVVSHSVVVVVWRHTLHELASSQAKRKKWKKRSTIFYERICTTHIVHKIANVIQHLGQDRKQSPVFHLLWHFFFCSSRVSYLFRMVTISRCFGSGWRPTFSSHPAESRFCFVPASQQ